MLEDSVIAKEIKAWDSAKDNLFKSLGASGKFLKACVMWPKVGHFLSLGLFLPT